MPGAYGTYGVFIDWDEDGGLTKFDFETGLQGWTTKGTVPPAISLNTTIPGRIHSGSASMQVVWYKYTPFMFDSSSNGFDTGRYAPFESGSSPIPFTFDSGALGFDTGTLSDGAFSDPDFDFPSVRCNVPCVVGETYTVSFWAYVLGTAQHFKMRINGVDSALTSSTNAWEQRSLTFTATLPVHTWEFITVGQPLSTTGRTTYIDDISVVTDGEDVTSRVLSKRTSVSFKHGRDQSRAMGPTGASEVSYEVLNNDKYFSPENTASPLYGKLKPGAETMFSCTYGSTKYNLYRGFIDEYEIDPTIAKQSVDFTASDALGMLNEVEISTEVYQGKTTGQCIGLALDAAGWPADLRDLDPGVTPIAWWWGVGTAVEVIRELVESEGTPAYITIDGQGRFVFRDRHHRLLSSRSTTSQATFSPSGTEPLYSAPMTYNMGWKELINSVTLTVKTRVPNGTLLKYGVMPVVWESPDVISMGAGETKTIVCAASDPFIRATVPVNTWPADADNDLNDFELVSGTCSFSLSRTSGESTILTIKCLTGPLVIKGMKLRAIPLVVQTTTMVERKDTDSIADNKERTYTNDPEWANLNDADAIARMIVGQRSRRLPTIEFTLNNGSAERFTQILTRDISDRIHLTEPQTLTDHDFFIESIDHTISEAGKLHVATFGCEMVSNTVVEPFIFDSATTGFNTGRFGYGGLDDPLTMFILDSSNLNVGLLAH